MPSPKIQRWFSRRDLAARYGVCTRSIERWAQSGTFPRGRQLPNHRWAWTDTEIEAHERSLVGSAEAAE
jgi:predicted DNA-binding transcriptional regulator AlpA